MSTPTARPATRLRTVAARPRADARPRTTGRAAGIVFAVLLGVLSMLALSPGGMPSFSLGREVEAVAHDVGSGAHDPALGAAAPVQGSRR